MKRFFLLFIVCVLAVACSDAIETNTPVIQGSVNNEFFRAPDASAVINEDGSVTLTGKKDSQTITLQTAAADVGNYAIGDNTSNIATFVDFNQALYVAGPGSGDGMIGITDVSDGKLSGTFYFNAYSAGGANTINFQKGVFFEVPVKNFTDDGTINNDTFSADIVGVSFVAEVVDAQDAMGILMVSGSKQTSAISLTFASDIAVGEYELSPTVNPSATYTVNSTIEYSATGTLNIVSNDTAAKIIEGTFEFTTDVSGTVIDNGTFKVSY